MTVPSLSVIIPAFGRAASLLRAAKSVLSQDVPLELIIVDDGSPDPIDLEIERTRIVRLPENQGPAGARNAGVAASRADWIAFLDSDDVWTHGSMRARLEQAEREARGDCTIWAAGFVDVRSNGQRRVRVPLASAKLDDYAAGCWFCPGSTVLMSRAAWARSGGQDAKLRRLEDYDWLLRWALAGGSVRVHNSMAAEVNRGARASPVVIYRASAYLLEKHSCLHSRLKRRMRSYLALEAAAASLGAGDALDGVGALTRSWLLHPRLQVSLEPFWHRGANR
jgi:glycosyltransferase involved in cell wall biosynthesis